jgi:two-component system OmpR family response regulator
MKPLKKILHIDDDTVMRMMVKKALERNEQNFEVVTCANPEEFLNYLPDFGPDLLIIDVAMPILSGPLLLEKIRGLGNMTPAIFMTGHESLDFKNRDKLDPIIGVIHKPFSPNLLGENLVTLWMAQS